MTLDASLGEIQAHAEATLDDLFVPQSLAATVEASGPGLSAVELLSGVEGLPRGPFAIRGRARWSRGGVAEFEQVAGSWVYRKDLGEVFDQRMNDEAEVKEMRDRLAGRLSERFDVPRVSFKKGMKMNYQVVRDKRGLLATVAIGFSVSPKGKTVRTGRYIERYRYEKGAWSLRGKGSLQERMRK